MSFVYRVVGWGYAVFCTALVVATVRHPSARSRPAPRATRAVAPAARPREVPQPAPAPQPVPAPVSENAGAAEWFARVKPYCNAVEVNNVQRDSPPPATVEGTGYNAACLALAGRIDDARRSIDSLSPAEQQTAASIVFEIGHPVADAGADRSAGPMMELVIDYIPGHYMALYHAGMAEYALGQADKAKKNLLEFLDAYSPNDGWRRNAEEVLARLGAPAPAADPGHP